MKRALLLLLCCCLLPTAVQADPVIYELVTTDGQVLARTEVQPTVGDTYWEASTDSWYTVLEVRGNQAIAGTPAETTTYYRTRNLRWGIGVALLLAAVYFTRRRLRPAGGLGGRDRRRG